MTRIAFFVCLLLSATAFEGRAQNVSLKGVVTDPSGASVPGAVVQLRGPGGERRAATDISGQYGFTALAAGKYQVRVTAKGFTVFEKLDVDISAPATLDAQLTIQAEAQVVNVEDEAKSVNTDPDSSGTTLVLGEKELEALSDDPEELEQQLQAMAGPGAGPSGGQIYIDGFTGGSLPAKASIREVRINANPFSPEHDRPGFGRIEIFTRPGADSIRGQAFLQFNDEALNSRSPLLAQSTRPPYQQRFLGFHLTGPIRKNKASFGFDVERRSIEENAFILATDVADDFSLRTVNQAVLTPQTRTTISPRIDYTITPGNTLVARFQRSSSENRNEGTGDFSLLSRAFDRFDKETSVQLTETAVLSPSAITETRFQYRRSSLESLGDNSLPAINVAGAFQGGGAQVGDSGTESRRWELTSISTITRRGHTIKWGARARQASIGDTSVNNFGGTYSFFGGAGPALDATGQPIPGTSIELTALERYRRTLMFQAAGLSAAEIRELGGGASQFALNAGTPTASVKQFDVGLFWNDDWRARPNLTLSYGVRYETQTNIGDRADWSPRIGIAWGIDGGANRTAKTVLRAGFGIFYDRVSESLTLQAARYNGVTQQSYLIRNPDFFPLIPALETLAANAQPQQFQLVYGDIEAPRTYQASIGIDRQFNRYFRLGAQYVASRGVHLLRSRNINAPIDGVYPFGDSQIRLLTESTGFSRSHMFVVSPNLNYKGLFLFGFYGLSYGKSDNEGQPADPYNLRAEWGPSGFADVRHRMVIGTTVPLPWRISMSPFFMATSGSPYNLTTGRDANNDGFTNERPALVAGLDASSCAGPDLVYAAGFGCLNLNPQPGDTILGRNAGRGPVNVNLGLRLARTWSFGVKGETSGEMAGPPPGGGMGPGRGGPGGPPPGGGMGGPPPGMFGGSSGRKYNLTLSVSARNVLNHVNWAAPSGDLSSPYFGQYRSLAGFGPFGGASTYNRKIEAQLRFTF